MVLVIIKAPIVTEESESRSAWACAARCLAPLVWPSAGLVGVNTCVLGGSWGIISKVIST